MGLFGFKNHTERWREERDCENRRLQIIEDLNVSHKLEQIAQQKYMDWKEDRLIESTLDKTNPTWWMKLPMRFERMVCSIYNVYDDDTAKYRGVNWTELVNKRFEELKQQVL